MDGWLLGYIIGAVVAVVVVVLLLLMISGARRTAGKAEAILTSLYDARDGTAPLWELQTTVLTAGRIVSAASAAREELAAASAPPEQLTVRSGP